MLPIGSLYAHYSGANNRAASSTSLLALVSLARRPSLCGPLRRRGARRTDGRGGGKRQSSTAGGASAGELGRSHSVVIMFSGDGRTQERNIGFSLGEAPRGRSQGAHPAVAAALSVGLVGFGGLKGCTAAGEWFDGLENTKFGRNTLRSTLTISHGDGLCMMGVRQEWRPTKSAELCLTECRITRELLFIVEDLPIIPS